MPVMVPHDRMVSSHVRPVPVPRTVLVHRTDWGGKEGAEMKEWWNGGRNWMPILAHDHHCARDHLDASHGCHMKRMMGIREMNMMSSLMPKTVWCHSWAPSPGHRTVTRAQY